LVFVKDADILLSGDKCTIVINIVLEDVTLVHNMKLTLGQIRYKIQVYKTPKTNHFDIHWEEVSRLETMVDELDDDLQHFRKLLFEETQVQSSVAPGFRRKRGLLNAIGYGLKYLFGTADAHDVRRLSGVCDKLQLMKTKMAHAIEHQMTYIHALEEATRHNAMDIVSLTKVLRDSVCNLSLNLNRVETDLIDTQVALEKQARYSAAIREIEMAILELKYSMIQLQE
jgi:hypothetical protein